ncbi:MAG: DegQ family serine endoprotease [Hyphomicrobiales bacterium]
MNFKTLALFSALVAAAGFSSPAKAEMAVPKSVAEITLSFAPVVKQTAVSVVNVYTRKVVQQRVFSPFGNDPFFRRFFDRGGPFGGVPRKRVQRSLGSGVIVDDKGIIVTNEHVIKGADDITVVLSDKREFDAKVMLRDPRTDLAVLRIDPEGSRLQALPLRDSDDIFVGDLVLAIGNPFGVGQTVTNGIISAIGRTDVNRADYQYYIQTDAAINPGNSGGALVDMAGNLIGINTAIFSRSGGSHGIGFAIPANMVRTVIRSALSGDLSVRRPWAGASLQEVTSDLAESLDLDRPRGALVRALLPASPLKDAGIRVGDVLLAINKKNVENSREFISRFTSLQIGKRARVTYMRNGKVKSTRVKLTAPPENVPRNETLIEGDNPFSGLKVANLSPAVADELRIDPRATGVIVTKRERGSIAAEIGFRRGDIIKKVNRVDVERVEDLAELANEKTRSWRVQITRGGRTSTFRFRY